MARYKKGEWSGRQQRVLVLDLKGLKLDDIAEKVGLKHRASIYRMQLTEEYQKRKKDMMSEITDKAKDEFKKHALEAVDKITQVMKKGSSEQRLQFDAAKEILHQVGCKPKEIIETISHTYTHEEIQSAYKTLKEVENTMNRLGKKGSRFALTRREDTQIEHKDAHGAESPLKAAEQP